jgi:hypothetical protein
MLSALCVAVAASPAAADPTPSSIAGRWQGPSYRTAALAPDCGDGQCTITLDIAPCAEGWCGVEVGKGNACGGTALKLGAGKEGTGHVLFEGRLELARATEPYVVQAYLVPAAGDEQEMLEIIGDTGGEFRVFRRSFPFHTNLVRLGEGTCRAEKPVS